MSNSPSKRMPWTVTSIHTLNGSLFSQVVFAVSQQAAINTAMRNTKWRRLEHVSPSAFWEVEKHFRRIESNGDMDTESINIMIERWRAKLAARDAGQDETEQPGSRP